jgi:hypothetical protein
VVTGHGIYQAQAPEIVRRHRLIDYVRERREAFREQPTEDEFLIASQRLRQAWWDVHKLDMNMSRLATLPAAEPRDHYYFRYANDISSNLDSGIDRMVEKVKRSPMSDSNVEKRLLAADRDAANDDIATIASSIRHIFWYDLADLHERAEEYIGKKFREENLTPGQQEFIKIFVAAIFYRDELDRSKEAKDKRRLDVIGQAARHEYIAASRQKFAIILLALFAYGVGGAIAIRIIVMQSLAVMEAAGWM